MLDANQISLNHYQGAQWVRADFHLHSPGAFSFKLPNGADPKKDRDQIVARYIQQLADKSIRIAAITDYQGVRSEWFMPIQEAAHECGIVVYPGAELSIKQGKYGLHVLVIFPLDSELDKINMAIQALDTQAQDPLVGKDGKHRDIDLAKNIKEALPAFRASWRALIIPAHPDNNDGLFKSLGARDAAETIQAVQFDAIESFIVADRKKMVSTSILSREFVDEIASVEFSDCHSIEEIGTKSRSDGMRRATYLKLSVFDDLRAIRLALHDPQILVQEGEYTTPGYTHFERLVIDGSGFLGGLSLTFSPELNVLVGGRGVGKSAILETIRYILDLPPYSPTEYREGLIRHALGSGGKAILYAVQFVNQNVLRHYRFERVLGEASKVFELNPEQEVLLAPLEVLGDQEGPLYFGQREIYEVTSNQSQRLRLLDEIVGKQAQTQLQQVQKLELRLRENARVILDKRLKLSERGDIEQRLKEIKHKIELYRRVGLVEKLRQVTTLAADEERLNRVAQEINDAYQGWSETGDYWSNRWDSFSDELKNAESRQKVLLEEAVTLLANLQGQLYELFQQGERHLKDAGQKMQDLVGRWQDARQPLDEEIRHLKQKLGEQSLDPDELIRLTTEQTRLEPQLRTLDNIQSEVERQEKDRRKMLVELREARRKAWKLRDQQSKLITEKLRDRVRVQVIYRGQRTAFVEELANFFRGSGVDRRTFERMAFSEAVMDGIQIVEKVRENADALENEYGLSASMAKRIYAYLIEDEGRLFDLELLAPQDGVEVSLKVNENDQPLDKLSAGQRATAMLLLLLAQEERLLIVDQPEDDLDNRFVYEDIVRILRQQKGKRQLVAATHNPNIPVLGNAELILALEAPEEHCKVASQGAIDQHNVQEFVRSVMEGGEEAFQRRAQKYGWR